MFRLRCLDDEHASVSASSASALELLKQLKCLLVGTEILQSEQGVGCYHSYQRQPAEIKSFGQDLGAYEYVYLAFGKCLYGFGLVALVLCRVTVQSGDLCVWEKCGTLASGNKAADSSSIFWVPAPSGFSGPLHLLHLPVLQVR